MTEERRLSGRKARQLLPTELLAGICFCGPLSRTHTHNHGETQVTYTLIGVTHTVAQLEVHIATPKNTMVLREKRQVCDAGSAAFFAQLTAQSHLQSFLSPQRPLITLSFCPNNPSLSTLRCWAFLLHKKCKEKKRSEKTV